LTQPKARLVACMAAPSHDHAKPLWPWAVLHGAKWSEHIAAWNPASSASWTQDSNLLGGSCSWDA
jgi:hypothetical protein